VGSDQKINVCHLISGDLWAGAEIAMFTMVAALKDSPELFISAIVLNNGKLAFKLVESGIPTVIIDESKNNFLRIIGKVRKIVKENQTDILHTHRYKENILGALAKRSCELKALVTTVHGAREPFKGLKSTKASIYSVLNAYFIKKHFDKVIAVSDEIKNELTKNFGSEKVVTVHNAIDPAKIRPLRNPDDVRRDLGLAPSSSVISVIGRMVPVKGLEVFLKMARLISLKRNDVVFLLVGDGPEKGSLEKKAIELGIGEKTIFTGFRDDIIDIINCLDILVLSSYHEGIPMVLLEGMALSKPVVATAVGGIVEVIENEVSGLLVERGDEEALAAACLRILDSPILKAQLVAAAQKRLEDEFSVDCQRERMRRIYRELRAAK
jgi:glycosyltransferase involved in cell wall biosynthesis